MSLHYCDVRISPYEVKCLHNLICRMRSSMQAKREAGEKLSDSDWLIELQVDDAWRWLASVRELLYAEWEALPDGSHLKAAYADEVWTWSDRDLASIPEECRVSPEEVRAIGEGFRRPTPEEVEGD
jgi:hypothetical protein